MLVCILLFFKIVNRRVNADNVCSSLHGKRKSLRCFPALDWLKLKNLRRKVIFEKRMYSFTINDGFERRHIDEIIAEFVVYLHILLCYTSLYDQTAIARRFEKINAGARCGKDIGSTDAAFRDKLL